MKNLFFILIFAVVSFPQVIGESTYRAPQPLKVDICDLYGTVYIEEVRAFADYKVYVQDIESFAKMVVYKETTEAFADRPGHWFFTETKGFEDFSIYIEEVEAFADFTIAYTDFQTTAGCQ
ncbi:MAG: DUF6150 family protein [Bacteroidia bacterium]